MEHPTVQDIFLRFYPRYLDKHTPSPQQSKVANCIINCKTGAYGANVSMCEDCGHLQIHYNSCRNRCCPMCQALPKEKWMDKRREDVLEAPYFHVVFTVPQELNPLIYSNQQFLYDAMYHCVSATIEELTSDTKHLGAKVGYICVLHTWGSEMNFHPHIHVILLGGGLTAENQWRDKGEEFFLPVKVLSKLFRGKYLDELKNLWEERKLQFHGSSEKYRNHYAFKGLLNTCYEKDWVPHCKKTFNGAQSVINYLGKYTVLPSATIVSSAWMKIQLLTMSKTTEKKAAGRNLPFPVLNLFAGFLCMCLLNALSESGIMDYYVPEPKPDI